MPKVFRIDASVLPVEDMRQLQSQIDRFTYTVFDDPHIDGVFYAVYEKDTDFTVPLPSGVTVRSADHEKIL